ncbi:hypothetical protein E2C01_058710 [Portunus trituberculatus]|uniref:Uncharacterized protein n=1 Tax=Portunus trituberculatus TaxID=210409 RepID=A0A5B7H0K1_PORTR|nr:hypothetical protein [Portunus trituberculatus]
MSFDTTLSNTGHLTATPPQMGTALYWWVGGLCFPVTWRARLEGCLGHCSALPRERGLPMLVRSPVRSQTKWFQRSLPVDQRSHPLERSPHRGHPVLDGWVSRLGCFGRGVSALSWTNIHIM